MGSARTDANIGHERYANELNAGPLYGTKLSVVGGGGSGHYTLIVSRLSRDELLAIIGVIQRDATTPEGDR